MLTRPDQAAGRGLRLAPSPVKALAEQRGLRVLQPPSLKDPETEVRLGEARADAFVVAAYGLLVPPALLALPPLGALNVHASLLPRWRGAAPIQRALLAGDYVTGVSIMKMDEGLDTGPVFEQRRIAIAPHDDAGTLQERLAALGGEALVHVLSELQEGRARAHPQPENGVSYAAKIDKRETQLDWRRPAVEVERAVRAFHPSPGASTRLGGEAIKIWRVAFADGGGPPGTLIDPSSLVVACGEGALRIEELQRAGGRRIHSDDFLRGRPLARGTRFQ